MNRVGMATHSISSFNESLEIRILSDFLESKRTIKTFFKENDKTPNYDGTFEILGNENAPKKQFLVQIKKVENLAKCNDGKNVGKYIYDLETPFLYYVKEKVTESPAIYFVVDIITKNIFWLYLSDETLMNLGFEGKQKVRFAFSDHEILSNIDEFTKIVNTISDERNSKFINKTPDEISEIQDSVEYINTLFNSDLLFIKKAIFPDLWRFGIANSQTNTLSMTIQDPFTGQAQTVTPQRTNLFALYPQIKGRPDFGFKEFQNSGTSFFKNFDFTGTDTPKKYVTNTISNIINNYFESGLPFDICPQIVLDEIAFNLVDKMGTLLNKPSSHNDNIKDVKNIFEDFITILNYIDYLLIDKNLTENEKQLSSVLIRNINTGYIRINRFDIIGMTTFLGCKDSFLSFYERNHKTEHKININLFSILEKKYSLYFFALQELRKREIVHVSRIWNYDYYQISKLDEAECFKAVSDICDIWLSKLPSIYISLYDKLFANRKYFNNGKFEYAIKVENSGIGNISNCIRKYKHDSFIITKSDYAYEELQKYTNEDDLKGISSGICFEFFIQKKMLFYDSLRCLLYQGICRGLGVKCNGLIVGPIKNELFNL